MGHSRLFLRKTAATIFNLKIEFKKRDPGTF